MSGQFVIIAAIAKESAALRCTLALVVVLLLLLLLLLHMRLGRGPRGSGLHSHCIMNSKYRTLAGRHGDCFFFWGGGGQKDWSSGQTAKQPG